MIARQFLRWVLGFVVTFVVACVVAFFSQSAYAQNAAADAEVKAAFDEAKKVMRQGPAEIKMIDQAVLNLPAGQVFIPMPEAGRIMRAMGNSSDPSLLGAIFPEEGHWMIVARYQKSGYIKDDDARDWNADDLLKSLKDGTEEGNKDRRQRGIRELELVGWAEKPNYEAPTHRLVWSAITKGKQDGNDKQGVNYNTYALGREGYISMNLVTALNELPQQKSIAKNLLGQLQFLDGKRYSDFNSSTDKVAEYGLAALVAGVAVKKLGLLAIIAAFFAKSIKLVLVAVVGLGALVGKLFGRNKA
ncbi:DUF2167 domain-containing protein [Undibacterium sp. Ji50W]|uniref:DUF2167 domain-containing protein n=1 Tax=Undibacterium sp. Ji50W TaxID=3413041 RepID=UPI003BF3610B